MDIIQAIALVGKICFLLSAVFLLFGIWLFICCMIATVPMVIFPPLGLISIPGAVWIFFKVLYGTLKGKPQE